MPTTESADFVGCRVRCGQAELEVTDHETHSDAVICTDEAGKRWRLSPSQISKCQILKLRGEPRT